MLTVLKNNTKKIYLALAGAVLLCCAIFIYTAAGPFISLYHIKEGVDAKDSARLSSYIDFESLRTSATKQLKKNISESMGIDLTQKENLNPLTTLMYGIANQLIETAVDNAVSPDGIALLMAGDGIDLKPRALLAVETVNKTEHEPKVSQNIKFLEWLKLSEFKYETHDQFSIVLYDKKDKKTKLLLTRNGLRWKLSDVIFDFENKN